VAPPEGPFLSEADRRERLRLLQTGLDLRARRSRLLTQTGDDDNSITIAVVSAGGSQSPRRGGALFGRKLNDAPPTLKLLTGA